MPLNRNEVIPTDCTISTILINFKEEHLILTTNITMKSKQRVSENDKTTKPEYSYVIKKLILVNLVLLLTGVNGFQTPLTFPKRTPLTCQPVTPPKPFLAVSCQTLAKSFREESFLEAVPDDKATDSIGPFRRIGHVFRAIRLRLHNRLKNYQQLQEKFESENRTRAIAEAKVMELEEAIQHMQEEVKILKVMKGAALGIATADEEALFRAQQREMAAEKSRLKTEAEESV
eukprot:9967066-Ditylum_brightwellii.AAC.1